MNERARILVFDSGVGGLSILESIRHFLGSELQYFYLSDQKFFPYGNKKEELISSRVATLVSEVAHQVEADMIVIACNTASTAALASLRESTQIPVVGVVPAVKPAVSKTQSGIITLLATPATIARRYTNELIDSFANKCFVVRVGSQRLVELAEKKILSGRELDQHDLNELKNEIIPAFVIMDDSRTDTIVLGCTHFSLIVEELIQQSPWPVSYLDSASAIASRVRFLFDQKFTHKNLVLPKIKVYPSTLFVTSYGPYDPVQWHQLAQRMGFDQYVLLD